MREQLKFENLVPEEKKTLEITPILPGEFQPRKGRRRGRPKKLTGNSYYAAKGKINE